MAGLDAAINAVGVRTRQSQDRAAVDPGWARTLPDRVDGRVEPGHDEV
jgi:hypothetical protein